MYLCHLFFGYENFVFYTLIIIIKKVPILLILFNIKIDIRRRYQ